MMRWWLFKKLPTDVTLIYISIEIDMSLTNCKQCCDELYRWNWLKCQCFDANFFFCSKKWIRKVRLRQVTLKCSEWEKLCHCSIPLNSARSVSPIENNFNEKKTFFHRKLISRYFWPSIFLMDCFLIKNQKLD